MSYILITITLLSGDYSSTRRAGLAEYAAGHYARAETLMRTALELARSKKDEYAEALSYADLGDDLQAQARLLEAEREYRKALSILNPQPDRAQATAIVLRTLASDLTAQSRLREARAALQQASKLTSKYKVQNPALNSAIANSLGVIEFDEGKIDKAENSFSHAAAFPTDDLWQTLSNLGHVYHIRRQFAQADVAYQRSLHLAATRLGANHPTLSNIHDSLGSLYLDMGRLSDAENHFQQSLTLLENSERSSDNLLMMHSMYQLAKTYVMQKDENRAQPLLAKAAAMARTHSHSNDMPEIVEIFDMYARVLKDLSNVSESEHVQTEARKVRATMAFTVPVSSLK
jgi:tetratricopeptide (TPR) repeat protein